MYTRESNLLIHRLKHVTLHQNITGERQTITSVRMLVHSIFEREGVVGRRGWVRFHMTDDKS